jgi:uncharacterized membrane protein YeaQ/YmgE (transglycosylase-associated protein family)
LRYVFLVFPSLADEPARCPDVKPACNANFPAVAQQTRLITPVTPSLGGALQLARRKIMSIIAWLILGLIAGFIGSKIVDSSGQGLLLDIVLGIVGAMVGGFLFSLLGASPVTGLNVYSLFVAVIGSIAVLLVYHALAGRKHTPV